MQKLIKKNLDYIRNYPIFGNNNKIIKQIVDNLNDKKICILSGMRGTQKTSLVKELIEKTKVEKYIYINEELDIEKKVTNYGDFFKYLITCNIKYKDSKLIILQNLSKNDGIIEIITELYKQDKYKILIVGNNIKIDGIEEIEIYNVPQLQNTDFSKEELLNYLTYGCLKTVQLTNFDYLKNVLLQGYISKTILVDIVQSYNIKNVDLYYATITNLANSKGITSGRELQRIISETSVSSNLATILDYINFSINRKIIRKCMIYDLKTQKERVNKTKYYFTDTGIRNSLTGFNIDNFTLIENQIFNFLVSKKETIYSGEYSNTYEFSFYLPESNTIIQLLENDRQSVINSEISSLSRINPYGKNIIILTNLDKFDYHESQNNITVCGIKYFINNCL